ncbi:MAG TPA: hypothetical protein VE178_10815 [Silvibacterium sp.]|nr:hypothetical protein [Silvibacterium sp.]
MSDLHGKEEVKHDYEDSQQDRRIPSNQLVESIQEVENGQNKADSCHAISPRFELKNRKRWNVCPVSIRVHSGCNDKSGKHEVTDMLEDVL